MQEFLIRNRRDNKIVIDVEEVVESNTLVFILHGMGVTRKSSVVQTVKETFKEHGYTTVIFDATNSVGESDGGQEEVSMEGYVEDLEDIIDWAKTQAWFVEPFALSGHSLGGYAAIRYAEKNPESVEKIVGIAPVISGKMTLQAYHIHRPEELRLWQETGHRSSGRNEDEGDKIPWENMEERFGGDLVPDANALTMPVLLVVGENDTLCLPSHQTEFLKHIGGDEKKLVTLKDSGHGFDDDISLGLLTTAINDWM